MKFITTDWYHASEFLPPYNMDVFLMYVSKNNYRCGVGQHIQNKEKVNTKENFYIDYLSPLQIRELGEPNVVRWCFIPE